MTEDGRKWLVLERDLELHSVDGYDRSQWNDAFVVVPATRMDTAVIRAEAAEAERDRLAGEHTELACKLSEAAEKIGRLEGEREAAEWPGVIEGWKAKADRLAGRVAALRPYLGHLGGCARNKATFGKPPNECDCGLAALAGEDDKPPDPQREGDYL